MAAKDIKYESLARQAIMRGVDILANAVKVTLGPREENVIIERSFGGPMITKDGVTVAKNIKLEDGFENLGAKMVKEVASKTSDAVDRPCQHNWNRRICPTMGHTQVPFE